MTTITSLLLLIFSQLLLEYKVSDPTIKPIMDPESGRKNSRILISFDFDTTYIHGKVLDAWIEIPDSPPPELQSLHVLEFAPITTPWNPENVSWYYPWVNPGGDFDTSSVRIVPAPDFTDRVNMTWYFVDLYAGLPRFGILLKPSIIDGDNFTFELDHLVHLLQQTTLHIKYLPTKKGYPPGKSNNLKQHIIRN